MTLLILTIFQSALITLKSTPAFRNPTCRIMHMHSEDHLSRMWKLVFDHWRKQLWWWEKCLEIKLSSWHPGNILKIAKWWEGWMTRGLLSLALLIWNNLLTQKGAVENLPGWLLWLYATSIEFPVPLSHMTSSQRLRSSSLSSVLRLSHVTCVCRRDGDREPAQETLPGHHQYAVLRRLQPVGHQFLVSCSLSLNKLRPPFTQQRFQNLLKWFPEGSRVWNTEPSVVYMPCH